MFDRTSFQGEQKFMTKTGAILTYPNRRRYLECYIHQSVIKGLFLLLWAGMAAQASRFSISTNFFSIRSLCALSLAAASEVPWGRATWRLPSFTGSRSKSAHRTASSPWVSDGEPIAGYWLKV